MARRKNSPRQPLGDGAGNHGLPELAPDLVEQEGGHFDGAVPTSGVTLPVVGLGGSAGGLPALQAFFTTMPADNGMAFVVIMHLSPEHESMLAEVLQKTTAMPVRQVRGRVKVEPNHVYVIPPARNLSMEDGHLILIEPGRRLGKHVAVDLFFRTLADTHGLLAAAIVLSGADGDGAIGIKRIKERGGLAVAQKPSQAEHDSMPRAAIATNMVDWVLPVEEMPARLLEYWRAGRRLHLPQENEGVSTPEAPGAAPGHHDGTLVDDEAALRDVLIVLRARTGHDFSYYKRATILRRVGRRLQVNGIADMPAYLEFLRTSADEAGALLQDLLISVTNFFRDRDAFTALATMVPALFRGKGPQDTVRVWVAACATGEEAYSMAMLLCEHAMTLEAPPKLQVFATDLHEHAIHAARGGFYPGTISADVTEERLRRFFSTEHGGYRINREVREMVLFALHDVLKDPPFSRLDLISCRNLLIYLNRDAQARALGIFHFALLPEGTLFLGSSESVDDGSPLFAVVDKKRRLFVRRATGHPGLPLLTGPITLPRERAKEAANASSTAAVPRTRSGVPSPPANLPVTGDAPVSLEEMHYEFIEQLAPPSVIVNHDHSVLHVSAHAGRFLQVGGGALSANLLQLVHPMLRIELRAALHQAAQSGVSVESRAVPVEIEGESRVVTLRVAPSRSTSSDRLLVIFQEEKPASDAFLAPAAPAGESESVVRHLERELEHSKAQLRDTVEQADASDEEQKASNEELQAMNEELRSAGEELETGREELQSINEELSTVNQELKSKVEELSRSNSDLQNLMAATQIATVFLDRNLCIQRYTPPAVALFNLIQTDVGRPISDLTPRLDYPGLAVDAARVLAHLGAVALEVAHEDGRYFLARMLPYRTTSDHIAGVVLTFVDITERKRGEAALSESMRQLEQQTRIFNTTLSAIADFAYIFDRAGRFLYANRALTDLLGLDDGSLTGKTFRDLPYPPELAAKLMRQIQQVIETRETLTDETPFVTPATQTRVYEYIFRPVLSADGASVEFVAGSTRDITGRKRAERHTAFLAEISDSLARLWTADEIMQTVGEKIGAYLGLSLCAFVDVDEAAEEVVVTHNWHRRDVKSIIGTYHLGEYLTGEFQRASRAGEVFVVRDTKADPRTDADGYAAIGVGAFVTVPVVRDGQWRFLLGMYDSAAHDWRDDEVTLMRELATRVWARVERARNEEVLRQSEARLRAVFESARDFALITMDVEGRITAWNPGAEAIFGAPAVEMPGHDARELFSPEDRAARVLEKEIDQAIGVERAGDDRWMQRRDGSRFWASGSLMPLRLEGQPPHGFLKILRDMTSVHEAEQARRHAEDRFALVVQSIQDYAIYMLDARGRITTWNQGAERIKGYTAQEAIGQPFAFCFTPEAIAAGKPAEELAMAAREGRFQEEAWRMRKDGSRYWGDELVVALRGGDGELIAYAKFCRDLTGRKRYEDERTRLLAAEQAARAEAEAASKAKDHFLAVLSHELRTPLTPVLMAVHLLGRNRNLSASMRDALEMIAHNVRIEAHLIDDLLDITKITRGHLEIVRQPMDLHEAVRRAVEISASDLEGKAQKLTVNLDATEHTLSGDSTRMQQVFWNLLKNASKFTPEEGSIHLRSYNGPDRLIVEVSDTGIGFEAEAATRIFDAFAQASEQVMRQFGGLGLGLSISKATVIAHGGALSARSDGCGKGATFTVELPLHAEDGEET